MLLGMLGVALGLIGRANRCLLGGVRGDAASVSPGETSLRDDPQRVPGLLGMLGVALGLIWPREWPPFRGLNGAAEVVPSTSPHSAPAAGSWSFVSQRDVRKDSLRHQEHEAPMSSFFNTFPRHVHSCLTQVLTTVADL